MSERPSRPQSQATGFSLPELAVALIVVGILAAIAAPSLLSWKADYDVRRAVEETAQTLNFFQRESIRRSPTDSTCDSATANIKGCCFSITNTAASGSPGISSSNCSLGNLTFPAGVQLNTTASTLGSNIKFATIGSIILTDLDDSTETGQLVFQNSRSSTQRCVLISQPLGLIRTGIWQGGQCS